MFAALAQFGARLRGAKNDASAWPWRNAARVRFSRARLRAALAGRFRVAAGWLARDGETSVARLPRRGKPKSVARLPPIVLPIIQLPVTMALLLPLLALVTFFLLPEGRAVRSCAWRRRVPPVYSSVLLPATAAGGTRWRWCSSSSPSPSSSSTSRSASSTCRSSSSPAVLL